MVATLNVTDLCFGPPGIFQRALGVPDWPPITQSNPLRASSVKRAHWLTPHGGVLLLSCCHLGVYLPDSLHLRCHKTLHTFPPV